MYRELRPAAFHPLSIAQACRELLLILRCWRIIGFLLLTRWVFSAFRCQYQAFTSSFWIRYFTKWSLLGKRECVTRSFSVAFHHTLANSQLWAVLDDSRSGWRDASGFKAWSTDNDWKSHDLTEVVRIVSNAARRTGREIDGTLKIIS